MESLRKILVKEPDLTYGVITERKDTKTYIVKVGEQYVPATWTGAALVNGETVLINRTKLGVVITQQLGMPGDVDPEIMVIDL